MTRRRVPILPLLAILAASGGLAVASTVTDSTPGAGDRIAPKANTTGRVSVESTTSGGPVGVTGFIDEQDRRCAALGASIGGRVGARVGGRFVPVPLSGAGMCLSSGPVAVMRQLSFDDPSTPADEASTLIWGVAAEDVERLDVRVRDLRLQQQPAADGTFVLVLPGHGTDAVTVDVARMRGSTTQVELPAMPTPPSLDEIRRGAPTADRPAAHP